MVGKQNVFAALGLATPCFTMTDMGDSTCCSHETRCHYCSKIILYTLIGQGDKVFEDAAVFNFLHRQRQNRLRLFAYSFWQDES